MVCEGFSTVLSLAMTRPASIAARARARLSNRPRSTSRRSTRLWEGEGDMPRSALRGRGSKPFDAGARSAEEREIGDDRVGCIHHRFIAFEDDVQRCVSGLEADDAVERIKSVDVIEDANLGVNLGENPALAPSDLDCI